ncbi:1-propanol dehydrogenase PduQ [Vallitalea okinawensis]|uniref:1-propanol dehydrogenase PduQ n=1 Tax=Vallitalea okinawensis TaxID=2078660 RepID=UPI000CFBCDB5|nr:1-propanol dehydrogenase PduQ [Vallitalea okinawensis]
MKFQSKTEIHYGMNSVNYIHDLDYEQALIVTDQFMVKLGLVKKITNLLDERKVPYTIFDEVEPNPSVETVTKGLHHIIRMKPDLLLAVGGGSAIDAAKAIMYFCIKTKEELVESKAIKKPWFVAIPTTSGTGSEVTAFSVVTDKKNKVKIPLVDNMMIPDVAILDAEFTRTVPPSVTADTGMDVLVHAIEAFVSTNASDYTDIYAKKAIKDVFTYLIRTYNNGNDMDARQKMQEASCMAGIGFTNAGLGINHSLAHAIGGMFKISHGRANAILLPYIIKYNAGLYSKLTHAAEGYYSIAKDIGLPASSIEEGIRSLIEAVKILNEKMGIPLTLQAYGIDTDRYERKVDIMARSALEDVCTGSNPRKPEFEELTEVLKEAYTGR